MRARAGVFRAFLAWQLMGLASAFMTLAERTGGILLFLNIAKRLLAAARWIDPALTRRG